MDTGTKISGIAHVTLIGAALIGGTFRSEPLPFEVQDVSVISAEEFAALTAPRDAPEVVDQPAGLEPPDPAEEVAALQPVEDQTPEPETPEPVATPEPEAAPEVETPVPTPEPETVDEAPTLNEPDPEVTVVTAPPGQRPKPRPVDRVAPEPVAAPPPDATPDEVETPPVVEDDGAETPQEPQEQTAPEEATDQIVTEATETEDSAPLRSPRPPARRPNPPAETEPQEVAEPPAEQNATNAVEDALQEALAGDARAPGPSGPPLTGGEKDAFRIAVQNCWNVDVGSQAANVTVVVGMQMEPNGKVVPGTLRMISSTGGEGRSVDTAFQSARRAILRCQKDGYALPADKYDHWREIEITFNPERMRTR